ncbi:tetratricopeptide repeat protein [Palleronia sp. KMU-117]|uniref:tetratricopeptide repeat protein n=1 Tax=Palleronia sp. KMU-117 TaxID=3434108 RepID=UPI003D71E6B2
MANQDSFIDEVTEDLRRDRLFALMRRYGWIAILAVLLIVGGAAWNEWRKATAQAEAERLGDAIIAALETEDPAARRAALEVVDTSGRPDLAALVGLLTAGADIEGGDLAATLSTLDALAASPEASPLLRDLAALKAVMAGGPTMSPDERITRVQGLALPGAPYRLLALEQIALAEIDRGNVEAALDRLNEISADSTASQGLRNRATQLIVVLGGAPDGA